MALEKEKNLANPKWNVYGDALEIREQKLAANNRQLTLFDYDL
ncbi:MAG: hypothetical protein UHN47_05635 [Lachnospiraceae bacterium]|nr:hypothetical protein [Lachnospiraceae bacterium]